MTPILLYTWGTPNGQKASIMLEEVGLPYVVQAVDIGHGGSRTPEYLAMDPNGKIPLIEDRDAGRIVSESGAILLYLAERAGRMQPLPGSQDLTWMFFQAAHVGPMLGQLGYFALRATEPSPDAVERFTEEADRLLQVMERRLSIGDMPYLAGDEYTIADIASYPWVMAAATMMEEVLSSTWDEVPAVQQWLERVGDRPAVQRGMRVLSP